MVDELCTAQNIEYKAYLRILPESQDGIVFVVATCWYASYGQLYTVYVKGDESNWTDWSLWQTGPDGMPLLNSYHVASGIKRVGLPIGARPQEVTVTDAYGAHTVPVELWS